MSLSNSSNDSVFFRSEKAEDFRNKKKGAGLAAALGGQSCFLLRLLFLNKKKGTGLVVARGGQSYILFRFLFSNKKGGTGMGWEGSSRTVIERGGGERRFVTGGDLEEK